ncbi:DUF2756 domain-containing protein, partial [Escherichia sp. HC-CC]
MKRLLILTALLPFVGFAQPINTLNNPNQPGYQIPSQQRMQTQMQTQQIMAEAEKYAYADRSEYLGDPDFVK